MRVLFQIEMDTEAANRLAQQGKLGEAIGDIVDRAEPEAIYFGLAEGQRTAFMVVDIGAEHRIPELCEPWFIAFNASVELQPVMDRHDLEKATEAMQDAVRLYGQ